MIFSILAAISSFILKMIGAMGYAGIFLLMLLESAGIPIPSEVIMPFSGFLVSIGRFHFWTAVLAGTLGNLAGSLLLYGIARRWGKPFFEKFGKYFFFSLEDLALTERWFQKYGKISIFLGRILPIVRTYISFPAGLARMDIGVFNLYTLLGAFLWSWLFTFIGLKFGENWEQIVEQIRKFDFLILALILLAVFLHIKRYNSKRKHKVL